MADHAKVYVNMKNEAKIDHHDRMSSDADVSRGDHRDAEIKIHNFANNDIAVEVHSIEEVDYDDLDTLRDQDQTGIEYQESDDAGEIHAQFPFKVHD